MAIDSAAIDTALFQLLSADPTLAALMPNGVHFDNAPPNSTRYVLVGVTYARDERQFQQRSFEAVTYLVKAVALTTVANANSQARQAAARIDTLLDPQPPDPPLVLAIPGYQLVAAYREDTIARIRHTEVDDVDPTVRFYHRGGHYTVVVST
jgi:hypothetical protein